MLLFQRRPSSMPMCWTALMSSNAGLRDVVRDAPPQAVGLRAQVTRGMGHGQLAAQRQGQGLEQQGEAAARACPGHGHHAGLAATRAAYPGDIGVQPSFELEKIQMAPGLANGVVDALFQNAAVGAGHGFGGARHIEIDAAFGGVELDALDLPGPLQAQGRGEKGFDLCMCSAHGNNKGNSLCGLCQPVTLCEVKLHSKRH